MSEPIVRIFDGYDELSRAAAARFVELAVEKESGRNPFSSAFSGGSTPKGFFKQLAKPEFSEQVDWNHVQLFQVDERPVPPEHEDSNYRMIREMFLNRVIAANANFHRMRGEDQDLQRAARDYQSDLAQTLSPLKGQLPCFDLILLGLGGDGHTASLFPETPALAETDRWVCPNDVAKLGSTRLTLTYPVLNASREIIFLVSGKAKAKVLKEVLEGPRQERHLPSQGIHPARGCVFWYVDRVAAALLGPRSRRGD